MSYNENFCVHMLCIQLFLLLNLIPAFDCIHICESKSLQCPCGKTNTYSIHLKVKQCTKFYEQRPYCVNCEGDPSDKEICANFQNCLECDEDSSMCLICPSGKYGTWCTEVCPEGSTGPRCGKSPSCSAPSLHINGGKAIDWTIKYPISSRVTYKCYDGYEMKGSPISHCLEGGVWSTQPPKCTVPEVTCKLPPIPFSTLSTAPTKKKANLAVETRINFSCEENYVVLGEYSMTCLKDGTWSSTPPMCVPKDQTCSHPGEFVYGDTTVIGKSSNNTFFIGTSMHFTCYQEDHYLSGVSYITCEINNTWSSTIPTCVKVIACRAIHIRSGMSTIYTSPSRSSDQAPSNLRNRYQFPTQLPQALKIQLPEERHYVGTIVSISCFSPFYRLEGNNIRKCDSSGKWSGRQTVCNPVCGRSSSPLSTFIANGTPSLKGQWPWQVAIAQRVDDPDYNGDWFITCGGTIISESFVLTAAHCVTEYDTNNIIDKKKFQLYFGKYYRNDTLDDEAVQKRFVEDIIVHPDYVPGIYYSDIALIRLESEIEYTSRVQQVCLPKDSDDDSRLTVGNLGTLSGWGITEDYKLTEEQRNVQVSIISNEQCRKEEKILIYENMICVYDAWYSISGSPFVFPKSSKRDEWVLEGIASSRGPTKQYGFYTRVGRFMRWIEYYLNKEIIYDSNEIKEPEYSHCLENGLCTQQPPNLKVNICESRSLTCQCGRKLSEVIHQVKQCEITVANEKKCGNCKDEPTDDEQCALYRNCHECKTNLNQCQDCVPGKFGKWCNETEVRYCPTIKYNRNNRLLTTYIPPRPLPDEPKNSNTRNPSYLTQLLEERHHVGTEVFSTCTPPFYYNLEGDYLRKCNPSGEWSGRQPICNPVCGRSSDRIRSRKYIVNGTPSLKGEWPWQVAIARRVDDPDYNGDWFINCGGTIISESFVITAARCVVKPDTNITIHKKEFQLYFGKYYRNDTLDDVRVEKRFVAEIIVHPDYVPGVYDSNIALIRLESDIKYTDHMQRVCLPKETDDDRRIRVGNLGTLSGWGITEDYKLTEEQRNVQVSIISHEQCQKGRYTTISANMICADTDPSVYDACYGLPGSPIVFPKSFINDEWVLEGIASSCVSTKRYGVYTRVRRFMSWIENYT